ncbi:MAG: hypothetical protein JSV84_07960 [Gemmatimonadota bacterium]|nr:MAG: hypothetical protein JSV84_07960 [Gemmatimonadota bacterium]
MKSMKLAISLIGVVFIVGTLPENGFTHITGCPHTHTAIRTRVECNPRFGGQACTCPTCGGAGTCREVVGNLWRDCLCICSGYPHNKKSAGTIVYGSNVSITIPGTSYFELDELSQENEIVIWLGDDYENPILDVTDGISGTVTLQFGESDVATHIPVQLLDFTFTFPSFKVQKNETGVNSAYLDPNFAAILVYNRETGELSTEEPLHVVTINDLYTDLNPLKGLASINGTIDEETGELFAFIFEEATITSRPPVPALTKWSILVLLLMLLIVAAWFLWRKERVATA